MFHLPPQTHKARELMGEMSTLVEQLNPKNAGKLVPVWKALRSAREIFEKSSLKPSRICFVVIRLDSEERWLISVGPKGGWRKEWNFGNGKGAKA